MVVVVVAVVVLLLLFVVIVVVLVLYILYMHSRSRPAGGARELRLAVVPPDEGEASEEAVRHYFISDAGGRGVDAKCVEDSRRRSSFS